jgi:ParB family transcriptional regulator, chromosome partitioning protein
MPPAYQVHCKIARYICNANDGGGLDRDRDDRIIFLISPRFFGIVFRTKPPEISTVCLTPRQTFALFLRRRAAARKAGLAAVPAIFIAGANCAEIALVENLLRQDLTPVEEAEALQRLMDEHAYPQGQLAAVIGKSQPAISKSLSLNRLPREIRDECRQDRTVPKNVLVVIARKKQARGMLTQFRKYQEQQAREADEILSFRSYK